MHLQMYNILIKLPYIRYLNKNINSSLTNPTRNSEVHLQRCYDDSVTKKYKI